MNGKSDSCQLLEFLKKFSTFAIFHCATCPPRRHNRFTAVMNGGIFCNFFLILMVLAVAWTPSFVVNRLVTNPIIMPTIQIECVYVFKNRGKDAASFGWAYFMDKYYTYL